MQINNQNPNTIFNGMLYGKMGNHTLKGISCCKHGDAKFIKTFNKIAKEHPEKLKLSYENQFSNKLVIETTETPKVSFFEKIFYIVDKFQQKAIKLKKEGKITSFTYKISEYEYDFLKKNYPFIRQKTLDKFEDNLRELAPKKMQGFLNNFFYK